MQALRANLDDLAALKELQQLLFREIVRAEGKIRKLKAERKAINNIAGGTKAKQASYLANRVEGLRQGAYIWRCFGDAIAFLYMDKFALKHCFYSTETPNAKQDAGFIVGKTGLANEIALLEAALADNIPAILVDLTNTIRHGDICLMGEPDPYLIEVKASRKLDSRGKKQKRSLEKLRDFYETDKSTGLRGYPEVRRQTSDIPERTYVEQINQCILEAKKIGHATCQPEPGLNYVVIAESRLDIEQLMIGLKLKAPWVFGLNEFKSQRAWAPYFPFILSIEDKDGLWDFIKGDVFILVLVETDRLTQIALDSGYEANFDCSNTDYPLRIKIPDGDDMSGISSHILARIGLEFVSPEWIVLSSIEMLKRGMEAIEAERSEA